MSISAANCDGYEATITGWASGITKAWAFAWFKTSDGSAHRGLVQLTENVFDGTQDYFGLTLDGSINVVGTASTANVDIATPDPGDFYLWQAAQQNKWTVGCAVFDISATASDLKCIFGRAAATAKPATTQAITADMGATSAALTRIRVLADRRRIVSGDSASDSSMSSIKAAYIAVGQGDVPTQAQIQSCIDGMHPADLPGVWEYWDLTSSSAGLVGALRGITLAPFGGSATTTWDGADNPTVSPPSGGGGNATANGVTITAAASLMPGAAVGQAGGTANGATITASAAVLPGSASGVVNGTLNFQAAGMEFGARTGLGIGTFALDAGVSYRYTVHADALTLGPALHTSAAISLDSAGKLPNYFGSAVTPGTTYRVVAVRQTDGEAAIFRMAAA